MVGRHHKKKQNQWKYILVIGIVAISIILFNSCNHFSSFKGIFGNGETGQESSFSQSSTNDHSSPNYSSTESENNETTESNSSHSIAEEPEKQLIETPNVGSSDWNLILVNRYNQLDTDLEFEHYYTDNGMIIDSRIAEAYEKMIEDGQMQGLQFILVSSYRSLAQQQANYDSVYSSYLNQGYSSKEAIKKTEEYIALPNASEHSTGLAVDITEPVLYNNDSQGLVEEFEDTPEGKWLQENAADYGFILRYPRGKERITIIEYESWHFRYVGVENAHYIKENNLTLEEYVEILKHNEEFAN